ncbi:phosphoribosylanthranilate isomerase [Plantibacter cousiniae]|uniref:N-(5'-phosphoribosyl)anthranilate isomerase n=2 Tax=Plantibacter cousiniae (nom. nud.) TaxID=199709 RepID=A0ABY1LPG4_9MICO|nr:phosphoribosylanthranilate isomerase [Plantibacter cousiniae]
MRPGSVVPMWVKVCGLSEASDVAAAVDAGVDAIGFVFAPGSPRTIEPERVASLLADVPESVLTVGVFRRQSVEEVSRIAGAAGVQAVQLHGDEPPESFQELQAMGWRTLRATSAVHYASENAAERAAYAEELLLLDAPDPGAGKTFDTIALVANPPTRTWILAGGLTPENVQGLIAELRPWGVDVSSGVESSRGVKSPELIRSFVHAARTARAV